MKTSSHRAPDRRWLRTWLEVLVLAGLCLAGIEIAARAAGIQPSYEASPRLWSYWRTQTDGDPVVVLGTSKSQLGVDPEVLSNALDREVANLAVNGSSPLPFLSDLARDEKFRGLVICEFPFAAIYTDKTSWNAKSQRFLTYHRQQGFTEPLENRVRFFLQGHLALLQPQVEPLNIARQLVRGAMPEPFYVTMRFDRYQRADYGMVDVPKPVEATGDGPELSSDEDVQARVAQVAADVAAIASRGGRVVFVRHISTGASFASEQQYFPRRAFAGAFADATGAPVIEFTDFDGISSIAAPDGVHLDYRDSARYTEALAAALKRQPGLLSTD